MKKIVLMFAVCVALAGTSFGQLSTPILNDTTTGTTCNKPVKLFITSSATSAVSATSSTDADVIGIADSSCGTTGSVIVTTWGVHACVFDNATTPNDYVQVATGGGCHDTGSTRPTSGTILGTVFGTGGAAGTYNVYLDKAIAPSGGATVPICSAIGSSDTISAAGTFSTTCSVPSTGLGVGSFLEIRAHGVLTTPTSGTSLMLMQVNAGGTGAICSYTAANNPGSNLTNTPWDVVCYIQIVTTGAPGTAIAWGLAEEAGGSGGIMAGGSPKLYVNPGTVNYTTSSAQTVSIQETGTLLTGQSFTLQSLVVRNY